MYLLHLHLWLVSCRVSAGKTTRTATVTTHWLLPWMGINLFWAARTTIRRRRGLRTTRPRARRCCWAPPRVYSPCTAWPPRRDPAPSRYRAAQSRCTTTTTTPCTTTPYWTLCLLIWWTSALKTHRGTEGTHTPTQTETEREKHRFFSSLFFFSFWRNN